MAKKKNKKPEDATKDPMDKLLEQLKELQEHLTPEEQAQVDLQTYIMINLLHHLQLVVVELLVYLELVV